MTQRNSQGRRRCFFPRWGMVLLAALLLYSPNIIGRDYPPEVGSPKPFKPPTPAVLKLPNGLSVVVVERPALPLLTLHLVVRSGAESDPPKLPGTAQLTAEVLTQGTTRRNARAISEAVDAMGGHLSSSGSWDLSSVELTVLSDK